MARSGLPRQEAARRKAGGTAWKAGGKAGGTA
ncbi:MAG: hypothetical protein ACLPY2_22005 [Bryobacteraceae bacterium]